MAFLERNANRGSISTGFNIDNSAAFAGANGIQFNPSSDGNQRTWTMSLWLKRSELSTETTIFGAQNTAMVLMDPDWFRFHLYTGSTTYYYDTDNTNTVFRDTAAWYHFVFQCDTTQGTAANRTKLYINGAIYTGARGGSDTSANIPQNTEFQLNDNTVNFNVGYFYAGNEQLDGYMSDIYFTDGVANDADAFGEYDEDSGIWTPKAYEGSYGTNGFHLEFKESGASATGIGKDTSGNGNNFSTGGAYPSQATDTPTNNFCTINTPFDPYVGSPPTISNGATVMTGGASGQQDSYGTMALFKGKWYFEFSVLNVGGLAIANMFGGVVKVNRLLRSSYNNAANGHHSHDGGWGGNVGAVGVHSGSVSGFSTVSGAAVDKVVGVAVDMDNGKIWWASGGVYASSSGTVSNPATATLPQFTNLLTQYPGEPVVPAFNHYVHQASTQGAFNFGGHQDHAFTDVGTNSDANGYGSFAYTPPSGYFAICSKNLAEYG